MNSLKEWADSYREKRIWVFPYNTGNTAMANWKYWRDIKEPQYLKQYEEYKWNEADGIKVVVGKKGIRVLIINKIDNEKQKAESLHRALTILKLPIDYPWIIEIGNNIAIIVDTLSNIMGMGNRTYAECLLLWEGSFVMPSSSNKRCFYKNRLPDEHPIQIKNEVLFACIRDLRNYLSTKSKDNITHQTSEEAIKEATNRINRITYKYDDFFMNFVHIGLIVWLLLGGALCFYFISGILLALVVWLSLGVLAYYAVGHMLRLLRKRNIERYIEMLPEDEMVRIITKND